MIVKCCNFIFIAVFSFLFEAGGGFVFWPFNIVNWADSGKEIRLGKTMRKENR